MSALLAIDTALRRAVVALGRTDGALLAQDSWVAGHRHGEELLPRLTALLDRSGVALTDVEAVIVGIGPGAFTGLRVGIATAKALAHGLQRPIVGVSTAAALLGGVPEGDPVRGRALLLPAGPADRVLIAEGAPATLLPAGTEPPPDLDEGLIAVDLEDRAPAAASARGQAAVAEHAAALLRIGAQRLARGERDDLARLVPEYVTLPRGVQRESGEVAWSHGRR